MEDKSVTYYFQVQPFVWVCVNIGELCLRVRIHTCACARTLFAHWIIYILEIDLSCTNQSRFKFESSQISEVFGSKPGFHHIKNGSYSKLRIHLKLKHFSPVTSPRVATKFELFR